MVPVRCLSCKTRGSSSSCQRAPRGGTLVVQYDAAHLVRVRPLSILQLAAQAPAVGARPARTRTLADVTLINNVAGIGSTAASMGSPPRQLKLEGSHAAQAADRREEATVATASSSALMAKTQVHTDVP